VGILHVIDCDDQARALWREAIDQLGEREGYAGGDEGDASLMSAVACEAIQRVHVDMAEGRAVRSDEIEELLRLASGVEERWAEKDLLDSLRTMEEKFFERIPAEYEMIGGSRHLRISTVWSSDAGL
jgi:hypothetical protein